MTKPQNASLPQRSHRGQGNLTASGMGLGHAARHCSTPCGWEAGPCGGCSHWRGRVLPRSVKKARSHDSKSSKHMRKSTNTCEKAPAFWNAKVLSSVPRLELVNFGKDCTTLDIRAPSRQPWPGHPSCSSAMHPPLDEVLRGCLRGTGLTITCPNLRHS